MVVGVKNCEEILVSKLIVHNFESLTDLPTVPIFSELYRFFTLRPNVPTKPSKFRFFTFVFFVVVKSETYFYSYKDARLKIKSAVIKIGTENANIFIDVSKREITIEKWIYFVLAALISRKS